jgi:hypothetical protein
MLTGNSAVVLLKNQEHALPLRKPKSLAIIGQDAIVNPDGPNAFVSSSDLRLDLLELACLPGTPLYHCPNP